VSEVILSETGRNSATTASSCLKQDRLEPRSDLMLVAVNKSLRTIRPCGTECSNRLTLE
jgi:hypothetical protein